MAINGWTIAFQALNFLILVWLLQRFLYRPVLAVIARRQDELGRIRSEAEAARSAAEALRRQCESDQAALAAERQSLAEAARAAAAAEGQALLDRARADAAALLEDGRARLERERRQALAGLKRQAVMLGGSLAESLLQPEAADVAAILFERACRTIEALPPAERASLLDGSGADGPPVRIAAAVPVAADEAERWTARLAQALGRRPQVELASEPAVLGGVELHFPHAVLRHSWRAALEAAMEGLIADADASAGA